MAQTLLTISQQCRKWCGAKDGAVRKILGYIRKGFYATRYN